MAVHNSETKIPAIDRVMDVITAQFMTVVLERYE